MAERKHREAVKAPEAVKVPLFSAARERVGEIEVAGAVFGRTGDKSLLHEAVKMQMANRRSGTASTKTRGFISGGGKKPWRQKGTGRARAGSIRSSLWRHGSIAHGPKPRDYSLKINEKMLLGALRSALAVKFQENKLTVVDEFKLAAVNTKSFAGVLRKLELGKKVLVVDNVANRNLELSCRIIRGGALM